MTTGISLRTYGSVTTIDEPNLLRERESKREREREREREKM
jgi:hypothetical protein